MLRVLRITSDGFLPDDLSIPEDLDVSSGHRHPGDEMRRQVKMSAGLNTQCDDSVIDF